MQSVQLFAEEHMGSYYYVVKTAVYKEHTQNVHYVPIYSCSQLIQNVHSVTITSVHN